LFILILENAGKPAAQVGSDMGPAIAAMDRTANRRLDAGHIAAGHADGCLRGRLKCADAGRFKTVRRMISIRFPFADLTRATTRFPFRRRCRLLCRQRGKI